jgi:hypothetical protein
MLALYFIPCRNYLYFPVFESWSKCVFLSLGVLYNGDDVNFQFPNLDLLYSDIYYVDTFYLPLIVQKLFKYLYSPGCSAFKSQN